MRSEQDFFLPILLPRNYRTHQIEYLAEPKRPKKEYRYNAWIIKAYVGKKSTTTNDD